jgi:hypothetical protein
MYEELNGILLERQVPPPLQSCLGYVPISFCLPSSNFDNIFAGLHQLLNINYISKCLDGSNSLSSFIFLCLTNNVFWRIYRDFIRSI